MSYNKHTWETGETITAEKLNNIEDGVENAGNSIQRVAHLKLYNKYSLTFSKDVSISAYQWDYFDADSESSEPIDMSTLPDYDFIIVEGVNIFAYDDNDREVYSSLMKYQARKASEGDDEPIGFYITVNPITNGTKTCPANYWYVAQISLYKI